MKFIRDTIWFGTAGRWTRLSLAASGVVLGSTYLIGWTKGRFLDK